MSKHARTAVEAALLAIEPWDATEGAHRDDALNWVRSSAPIWRTERPATPPKHLVAYFLLVDPALGLCLLVDHRKAQLWLPTGGHVEPGEYPTSTVTRECREELGIEAVPMKGLSSNPLFVTETTTVNVDAGHVDVSLWYVCRGDSTQPVLYDSAEFRDARWWDIAALEDSVGAALVVAGFDPHLPRFLGKLTAELF